MRTRGLVGLLTLLTIACASGSGSSLDAAASADRAPALDLEPALDREPTVDAGPTDTTDTTDTKDATDATDATQDGDAAAGDAAPTDVSEATDVAAESPDATPVDAGPPSDAGCGAARACLGLNYCDAPSGVCLPGCDRDDQCAANERCDRAAHACVCAPDQQPCASGCCPVPTTWTTEVVARGAGSSSSLALTATGTPMIAYVADVARGLRVQSRGATSWFGARTVDPSPLAHEPALVIGAGALVANSASSMSVVSMSTWRESGGAWAAAGTISGADRPDLVLTAGTEHVAAVRRVGGGNSSIEYATRASGSAAWGAPVTVLSRVDFRAPRLAIAPGGAAWILFTQGERLMLADSRSTSTFYARPVGTTRAIDFDLRVTAAGVVELVYYTPDSEQLVFEAWSGGARTRQTIVDAGGGGGSPGQAFAGLSLADAVGPAQLTYLDGSRGSPTLRYARDDGTSFVVEDVGPAAFGGYRTSIAVDGLGRPHVSYPLAATRAVDLGYAIKR